MLHLNEEYSPIIAPMQNASNICWLNSIIQVLLGCTALNETILNNEGDFYNNRFAKEYINILKSLLFNPDIDINAFAKKAPVNILNALSKIDLSKFLTDGAQHDTDEALNIIIDILKSPRINDVFCINYKVELWCAQCNLSSNSPDDLMYIVDIPIDCDNIEEYILCNSSTTDINCCGPSNYKIKLVALNVVKPIIWIRFNKYNKKILIDYPLEFNVNGNKELKYKMIGQINHSGSSDYGHYTAFCLRKGKFYYTDDEYICESTPFPSINTYMICYHLV